MTNKEKRDAIVLEDAKSLDAYMQLIGLPMDEPQVLQDFIKVVSITIGAGFDPCPYTVKLLQAVAFSLELGLSRKGRLELGATGE